jgi:hypothetical protein
VSFKAELLDLCYAGRTIGFEYQPEQLGHEVIEFPTCAWIWEFVTFSASLHVFLPAARAHLTPSGFGVIVTAMAFLRQVGPAGTTIKPAIGDKFAIHLYIRHVQSSFPIETPNVEVSRTGRL